MIPRYSRPQMASIWEDENKFRKWLTLEILVCEALALRGEIPTEAAAAIRQQASFDVARIRELERDTRHDVVAFLTDVGESLGVYARYLHLGLTSSDLLDTTLAMQMREACDLLLLDMEQLCSSLRRQAFQYRHTLMMGRTHGVHAEPITFGLKMALWYDECRRNRRRLERAKEAVSYGKLSGAVGTYAHLDPFVEEYVCQRSGLHPAPVSSQIIQRDLHAELVSVLAIVASTIDRCATEIRHLQRTEVLEVEEPFGAAQKGSSAMPHKRNPVMCEQLSGLARLVRGHALAALEDIPLWHERDISHSSVERVILPDCTILVDYMLDRLTQIVDRMSVYPQRMLVNLERTGGLIFSEQVLLALMRRGLSRREAYGLVQKHALAAWEGGKGFKDRLLQDQEVCRHLQPAELEGCFQLEPHLRHVDLIFKRVFGEG